MATGRHRLRNGQLGRYERVAEHVRFSMEPPHPSLLTLHFMVAHVPSLLADDTGCRGAVNPDK